MKIDESFTISIERVVFVFFQISDETICNTLNVSVEPLIFRGIYEHIHLQKTWNSLKLFEGFHLSTLNSGSTFMQINSSNKMIYEKQLVRAFPF